jgi:hypothetical protein
MTATGRRPDSRTTRPRMSTLPGRMTATRLGAMGRTYDRLDDRLREWMERQPVFFVATAPSAEPATSTAHRRAKPWPTSDGAAHNDALRTRSVSRGAARNRRSARRGKPDTAPEHAGRRPVRAGSEVACGVRNGRRHLAPWFLDLCPSFAVLKSVGPIGPYPRCSTPAVEPRRTQVGRRRAGNA